ncbi:MAG: hypothetical protein HOW73_27460 [Polyangiaceae bacterium]|nr:hypothetical protein [Polyangiaceae bacterium]
MSGACNRPPRRRLGGHRPHGNNVIVTGGHAGFGLETTRAVFAATSPLLAEIGGVYLKDNEVARLLVLDG